MKTTISEIKNTLEGIVTGDTPRNEEGWRSMKDSSCVHCSNNQDNKCRTSKKAVGLEPKAREVIGWEGHILSSTSTTGVIMGGAI